MFHDLKLLTVAVERKVGKSISHPSDFEKLSHLFTKLGQDVSSSALSKVWNYVSQKEKPSVATLDKIALFVGFQNWDDFKTVLHGEDKVDLHYDEPEGSSADSHSEKRMKDSL